MAVFRRVYAEGYPYFITMTTQNRTPLLVDNIELLREAFRHSKEYFTYDIDSIVILPDHLHMIIAPKKYDAYPKIVRSVKTYFSKGLKDSWAGMPTLRSASQEKKRELGIWQRRFYEHTIRDEKDLQRLRDYVHYNPVKHGVAESAAAWKYSSFDRFVASGMYDKNWVDMGEELGLE